MLNVIVLALVVVILLVISKSREGMKKRDSEELLRYYFRKKLEDFNDVEQSDKSKSVRMGRGLGGVSISRQFKQTPYVDKKEDFTTPGAHTRMLIAGASKDLYRGFDEGKIRRLGVNFMEPPF